MDHDVKIILAGRKAQLFNEQFQRGDAVMHRLTPGGVAQQDRVYGAAFVLDGESVVELAGRAGLVPTDRLLAMPAGAQMPARPTLAWAQRRRQALALALAAVLGGAVVVLLAVATDPGRRAQAAGLDCDAPAAIELPTYMPRGVQV